MTHCREDNSEEFYYNEQLIVKRGGLQYNKVLEKLYRCYRT